MACGSNSLLELTVEALKRSDSGSYHINYKKQTDIMKLKITMKLWILHRRRAGSWCILGSF